MSPRNLGIRDEEIRPLNLDLGDHAKKVKNIYWEIVKGDDSRKDDLLAALLEWRDAVAQRQGQPR